MENTPRWKVVLALPGEAEMGLLAELAARRDAVIAAIVDPRGDSLGTAIAQVMGVPIHRELASVPADAAQYLVYPEGDGEVNDIAAEAEERGWHAMRSRDFRPLLRERLLERKEVRKPGRDLGYLETETETIHRTLSRIEEALEQESLLRWLLSLATRAAGAASGSLMLYDERSDELYIAFAYGLSEATVHGTRMRLGEGIAGKVAQTREARLVTGNLAADRHRDRPDIATAISVPLVWEGRLLGVLNLSSGHDDPPLTEEDMTTVSALSHRFGMILARFLRLQDAYAGEMFRLADRHLRELAERGGGLEEILPDWCSGLAVTVAAERASIAIPCEDGTLFVSDGAPRETGRTWHESLDHAAWREVLETGAPLVVREEAKATSDETITVFYLPVGRDPVQAVFTVSFASGKAAHGFHSLAGEVVYMLERRLAELIRNARQEDSLARLSELSRRLADLALRLQNDPERAVDRLVQTARGLTGARLAYILAPSAQERAIFAGGDRLPDSMWTTEALRLLEEARAEGWRVTLVSETGESGTEESCLLAVPFDRSSATPGFVLRDKTRVHPLDGLIFTAFDAELIQRLGTLLPSAVAALSAAREPAADEESDHARPEPKPPPAIDFDVSDTRDVICDAIRREMDRCDRYHTTFALVALRPTGDLPAGVPAAWARALGDRVRSSDRVFAVVDGTILLVVPEDTQSLPRLVRRLLEHLRSVSGDPALPVVTSYTIYPGRHDSADVLLSDTLAALD